MADIKSGSDRDAAINRAQKYFSPSEERDDDAKKLIEGERAATDAKTAKLRALRLAKEEAERLEAAAAGISAPQPAKGRPRKPK